jgi:hypothetical protein
LKCIALPPFDAQVYSNFAIEIQLTEKPGTAATSRTYLGDVVALRCQIRRNSPSHVEVNCES